MFYNFASVFKYAGHMYFMNGNVDAYHQINMELSLKDVAVLERTGQVTGKIKRTPGEDVPMRFYFVSRDDLHPDQLPKDDRFMKKGGYELYIGEDGLRRLKDKEVIGTGMQLKRNFIRFSYIRLEGVPYWQS